jgi:hypothetical protein
MLKRLARYGKSLAATLSAQGEWGRQGLAVSEAPRRTAPRALTLTPRSPEKKPKKKTKKNTSQKARAPSRRRS